MDVIRRGKKITTVRRGKYLVEVPIEVVYSPLAPDEPIVEAHTALLLDEVARHAEQGDVAWLKEHGKVYELVEA